MEPTLAFDVYGTRIDTNGVMEALERLVGAQAPELSRTWRDKQRECSFRRSLMQDYVEFSVCTRQALEYACAFHRGTIGDTLDFRIFRQAQWGTETVRSCPGTQRLVTMACVRLLRWGRPIQQLRGLAGTHRR